MTRDDMKPLTDQFRVAVTESGWGLRKLARQTGTDVAVLSKFMNGKGGLSIASIDAIARELGLNLTDRSTKFSRQAKSKRKDG